jgi:hypothetical protein
MPTTVYYIRQGNVPVRTYSAKRAEQASKNGAEVNAVTYNE